MTEHPPAVCSRV